MSIANFTDARPLRAETFAERYPQLDSATAITPRRPKYAKIKFALEWPFAFLLCIATLPIILLLLAIVRLSSRGPAIYRQTRLGRDGNLYSMLKIRTMQHNCEMKTGAVWSGPLDMRVTFVGRILRDTHLDELPQLWNVVRGEMSLIGPRPERPELVARIERALPRYRDRLAIRPGLTGFAQIQHTADLSLDHVRRKLVYDLYYVHEMSVWLDLRIAVGTVFYFLGMTLRAIGKMAMRSDNHVVARAIENDKTFDLEEADTDLHATVQLFSRDAQRSAFSLFSLSMSDIDPPKPIVHLLPPRGWQMIDLHELWRFRELLYFLTWRDVKVRYKQTLLGAAWAILQPAMLMLVFIIFLGKLAKVPSADSPLFVYAGLLPWTFFATAISNAGNSVVGSERLVTKIYFPRLAIPIASVFAALVDFAVAMLLLLALMIWHGTMPGASILLAPLILFLIMLTALGVGMALAALNVAYRDFRYVIPFMVQFWMFATPSVYMQTNSIGATKSGALATILALNPMTGLIAAFRAACLNTPIPWTQVGVSTICALVALFAGCMYFRRMESTFADMI